MVKVVVQGEAFGLPAGIRKLAETELLCHHPKLDAWDVPEALRDCQDCAGTGRIVPFAALRVTCPGEFVASGRPNQCRVIIWEQINSIGEPWTRFWGRPLDEHIADCAGGCLGRGWVPESDIEKACWRVWKVLPQEAQEALVRWRHLHPTWEEAVLREALGWLKEQKP